MGKRRVGLDQYQCLLLSKPTSGKDHLFQGMPLIL